MSTEMNLSDALAPVAVDASSRLIIDLARRVASHRLHGADRRRVRHRQGSAGAPHPSRQSARRAQPSSRSTARPSPRTCSKRCCSATRRGSFTGAHATRTPASSSRRRAARCCSTRSPRCRWRCRPSCCACCRSAKSNASAAATPVALDVRVIATTNRTAARRSRRRPLPRRSLLPPQRVSPGARRRCANAATTSCRWPRICCSCARRAGQAHSGAVGRRRAPAAHLHLARQRARARQPAAARAGAGRRHGHRGRTHPVREAADAQSTRAAERHRRRCSRRMQRAERDVILEALRAAQRQPPRSGREAGHQPAHAALQAGAHPQRRHRSSCGLIEQPEISHEQHGNRSRAGADPQHLAGTAPAASAASAAWRGRGRRGAASTTASPSC